MQSRESVPEFRAAQQMSSRLRWCAAHSCHGAPFRAARSSEGFDPVGITDPAPGEHDGAPR